MTARLALIAELTDAPDDAGLGLSEFARVESSWRAEGIVHVVRVKDDIHVDETLPMFRTQRSSMAIDEKEIEANQFAAELLMPAAWLREDLRDRHIDIEEDDDVIAELADRYSVSVKAMTIRLTAIGALEG